MQIIKGTVDWLDMPIYGQITDQRNIDILRQDLKVEKGLNDPTVTLKPLLTTYKENEEIYGKRLYEYNHKIKFIDVDVFRQPALTFNKIGQYCPYDEKWDKVGHCNYWDTIEYRLKHGMTAWAGYDEDGNRQKIWIPGKHYGFLNFAPINRVKDDDDAIANDSEFIGGEKEDDLSSMKMEDLLKQLNVRDTSTAKKVLDFPGFFDAQYHLIMYKYVCRLLGKNCWFGKARRKGMSYYNSYDLFDDINLNENVSVILAAHDKKYLTLGKGLMRMLYTYADFFNQFTDFGKGRLISNKEHLKFGFIAEGGKEEEGFLSEAMAVSAMNNPDVTIGKDVYQLAYEEMGKFPNWKESYNVTSSTAEAGEYKTGHICGWGTGGTDEANWAAFEDVCYQVETYDGLACNNVWDLGEVGNPVAYFYAHIHGLEGHMDYNGNTNFESAWASYLSKKDDKRKVLSENEFEKWCGQRANCPLEAFAKSSSNIFNREQITIQLNKVNHNPDLKYLSRTGVLVREDEKLRLLTHEEIIASKLKIPIHPPVINFPLKKGDDPHGCFVEWVSPWVDPKTLQIPRGLYVAWQDPYAHDKNTKDISIKDSLGVTYWWEQINNITPYGGGIPVANHIGRPPLMNDYNDAIANGLEYYNARLMFENERGDVKSYMQARRLLHMLYEEPELDFAKELASKTGRGFGMHMTDTRIAKGAIYLRDLLATKVTATKTVLDFCYDPGFLNELLRWGPKGNFDRVSSWLVGMYIIKELEFKEINPPKAHNENSLFNRPLY